MAAPTPYAYTAVEHVVVVESVAITVLKFADGRVSSDGFEMFEMASLDAYSDLLESTINTFYDLVARANRDLVRVPVSGVPQFEYREEVDGRWHVEARIVSDDDLVMDVWYDRETGVVEVDQTTSFDIELQQSYMWSDMIRRFVSSARVWDGSIGLPPAGLP